MELTINLTQHDANALQIADGIVDLPEADKAAVRSLITFDAMPAHWDMANRAREVARIAKRHASKHDAHQALIAGAQYFGPYLAGALVDAGIKPMHPFSVRSVDRGDVVAADGTVSKGRPTFKYAGMFPDREWVIRHRAAQ